MNGFRNVTASYGVNGFTSDHLAAISRKQPDPLVIIIQSSSSAGKTARLVESHFGMALGSAKRGI